MKFTFQNTQAGILYPMKHFITKMRLRLNLMLKFPKYQDLKLNGWKKNRIFLDFQNGRSLY